MSTISLYTGDGATKQFDITFNYDDADTVKVKVDGTNEDFTFVNSSRIELGAAPAAGAEVKVYRETGVATPVVDFEDGAIIRAPDLDAAIGQARNRAEELGSEIEDVGGRAVRVPVGEAGWLLPAIAERANKYLSFLPDGTPIMSTGTGADAGLRDDLGTAAGADMVQFDPDIFGAIARTIAAILRDRPISVKDFGAKGDGVTDDTAAIQAALDAVPRGGKVEFPRGEYKISDTLTCFTPGVLIEGMGAKASESTFITGAVLKKTGDFNGLVCSGYNIKVQNLSIIGQTRAEGSGAGVGHGLVIAGRGAAADRVVARYNGGVGVLVNAEDADGTPDAENSHWVQLTNGFTEYNGQDGVKFDSPNSGKMNMNIVFNWTSRHNDGAGYNNAAGSYMEYENADAEYNLGFGFLFSKGSYSSLINCHSEQNKGGNGSVDAGDGVRIADSVIQVRFFGGTFGEGGGGSDFETGISYASGATQQDRDLRAIGSFYKNKHMTPTSGTNGLRDAHFQAFNYRAIANAAAGFSATVTPAAALELAAVFYAIRTSASAIRARIAVGKNGTAQEKGGVDVLELTSEPADGKTGLLLLVNEGGTLSIKEVTYGAPDSGGAGYKVLRIAN